MPTCIKIPDLIKLEDCNNDYDEYEKITYTAFCDCMDEKELKFNDKPIVHKRLPLRKNMSGTYWHIVSGGNDEKSRLPDLRRYERIEWPFTIIHNCLNNCKKILVWENKRKGKNRTLIYCDEVRYLVVLDNRGSYYFFWTAYPVNYEHSRKKLLKEYNEYAKAAH